MRLVFGLPVATSKALATWVKGSDFTQHDTPLATDIVVGNI